jgi:glutaredoxin 3
MGMHSVGLADGAELPAALVENEAHPAERLEATTHPRTHAAHPLRHRADPSTFGGIEVKHAVRLAKSDGAQDYCFGLERTGHTYTLSHMSDTNGVTLYTTEPCGFCRQAKDLLQSRGVVYTEINLAKDPSGRADLVAMTGQMTFPQIVVGDCSIGGFRELLEADREGSLPNLLDRAA